MTSSIDQLKAEIENLKATRREKREEAELLASHSKGVVASVFEYLTNSINSSINTLASATNALSPHDGHEWDSSAWPTWTPPAWTDQDGSILTTSVPNRLRIGSLKSEDTNLSAISLPAYVPFLGKNRTLIIWTNGNLTGSGQTLLESLVARTAIMLPYQASYTLLDPAGNGAAFPMRRHLPQVRENSGDVRRDLEQVIIDIQRINESYLDASVPSFELVAPELRINERFHFVFAADFPNKYDRRAIEALQSIATTGPRTGTYVIIHANTNVSLPRDLKWEDFTNALYLDLANTTASHKLASALTFDRTPEPELQEHLFSRLRAAKPPERRVDWQSIEPAVWWQESATSQVKTPVGVAGATGTMSVWFGANPEGLPCAHGMLGAMTGSGKSNLYHVLIMGLCTRYSPEELKLYLIDGKDGVEFQSYRDLPHAAVISLNSSPLLSRSVLTELISERERRNQLFSEARVTDFAQYRQLPNAKTKIPRILLLVDEYQELFEGDRDGEASQTLLQLAQQGRSAGIHMLLGSQRYGAPGMLNQNAIFGNIHLRMGMQMTSADVNALSEFGRRGKQLLSTCDLPGKIVINDRSGDDAGNQLGKVAYLPGQLRQQIIERMRSRANEQQVQTERPILFDGKRQPDILENPYVQSFSRRLAWPTFEEMQAIGRRPIHQSGIGVVDWFSAERPVVAWLGKDFTVRGHVAIVLRRRASEHVLFIGGDNATRYGMLVATLNSIALNVSPNHASFLILDRSIPGTEWHEVIEKCCTTVLTPSHFHVSFFRDQKDASTVIGKAIDELARRQELPESELIGLPSLFVVMTELDRVDALRRRADAYSMTESELGQQLSRLAIEGSSVGIHLLLSFTGVRPMANVVDERRGLIHFRHRIGLQMSEDESLTFVRSRRASQLQLDGAEPVCALYLDVEKDLSIRFKPYSIAPSTRLMRSYEFFNKSLSTRLS